MSMNRDEQAAPLTERRDPASAGAVRSAGEPRRANEARSAEFAAQSSRIRPGPESPRFNSRSSNGLEHSVELHIQELVLDGFDPVSRYTIGEALERELTRLLTEEGALTVISEDSGIANIDAGAFELSAGFTAEAIGRQLAKAIYGGLGK